VTPVDETSKLRALWRARERLEAALAAEESWQTLQGLGTGAGARSGAAASLEAQLLSNPVYRAWKNVSAAIAARQPEAAHAADPALRAAQVQARPEALLAHPPAAEPSPADPGGAAPSAYNDGLASAEASVSFVAPAPEPARMEAPAADIPLQGWRSLQRPAGLSANPEQAVSPCEEAEVSVISVDARRHAGAVDRVLRALRGETGQG
jgi:hypothetical protein